MKTPFRGFNAILYKELIIVMRDPLTLFFMFFPPLGEMMASATRWTTTSSTWRWWCWTKTALWKAG